MNLLSMGKSHCWKRLMTLAHANVMFRVSKEGPSAGSKAALNLSEEALELWLSELVERFTTDNWFAGATSKTIQTILDAWLLINHKYISVFTNSFLNFNCYEKKVMLKTSYLMETDREEHFIHLFIFSYGSRAFMTWMLWICLYCTTVSLKILSLQSYQIEMN